MWEIKFPFSDNNLVSRLDKITISEELKFVDSDIQIYSDEIAGALELHLCKQEPESQTAYDVIYDVVDRVHSYKRRKWDVGVIRLRERPNKQTEVVIKAYSPYQMLQEYNGEDSTQRKIKKEYSQFFDHITVSLIRKYKGTFGTRRWNGYDIPLELNWPRADEKILDTTVTDCSSIINILGTKPFPYHEIHPFPDFLSNIESHYRGEIKLHKWWGLHWCPDANSYPLGTVYLDRKDELWRFSLELTGFDTLDKSAQMVIILSGGHALSAFTELKNKLAKELKDEGLVVNLPDSDSNSMISEAAETSVEDKSGANSSTPHEGTLEKVALAIYLHDTQDLTWTASYSEADTSYHTRAKYQDHPDVKHYLKILNKRYPARLPTVERKDTIYDIKRVLGL